VVLRIFTDIAERPDQRLVHVTVEHQRTAARMQRDLQDTVCAPHPDVFVFLAIVIEHAYAPRRCRAHLLGGVAAVHGDDLPRQIFRLIGGDEQDRLGDLVHGGGALGR
jgi:hypothetical protein